MKISDTQIEQMTEVAERLKVSAIRDIELEHGPNGRRPKDYHNVPHSLFVFNTSKQIAELAVKRGKIEPVFVPIISIAALFHDYYHNPWFVNNPAYRGENERRSAKVARQSMSWYTCFENVHLDFVSDAIESTAVKSTSPRLEWDLKNGTYPIGILPDADLASFGSPPEVFMKFALGYQKELDAHGGQDLRKFLEYDITLLTNHRWNTEEAQELFPHIPENINALREELAKLDA
jgi:hypothetical protein